MMKHSVRRILTCTRNWFRNDFFKKNLSALRYNGLALMFLGLSFFSCQDPLGIYVDTTGGKINTSFTDTIKVASSTLLLDSTFTSGQSAAVVGGFVDPIFGEVSSKIFAQISLPLLNTEQFTALVFPDADKGLAVYDSAYIYVAHNGFIYGDTTQSLQLSIHRLTDNFEQSKKYTKDDFLSYGSEPIVSKSFDYKSIKRALSSTQDSLMRFKLSDVVGQELFNLIGTDAGTTIDKFTAAVKGIAIVSNKQAKNIVGISVSNSYLKLFYHTTNSTDRKSLPLTFNAQRFSQIQTNRQGTIVQNLETLKPVSKTLTNQVTFLQTGTGIVTKLELPNLAALQKLGNVTINRAELVVRPDSINLIGNYQTPPQISLVQLESTNQVKRNSAGLIDFVALSGVSGTQYVATYDATNNKYSFNFSSFLQDLISKKISTNGIAIVPSLLNTSNGTISIYNSNVSRMVIKDIKLNVYYTTQ